jgi:hypothetical protein
MTSQLKNHHGKSFRDLPAFTRSSWQMSYGERATIEGMLSMIQPRLSLEIGRAEGGSLRRLAEHSKQVLSFDIVSGPDELGNLANVRILTGDSHVLLPRELDRLTTEGAYVDFVLLDGDHSADGVRTDMEDLLSSPAVSRTVILAHDTLNEEVRCGLGSVDFDAHAKVSWVDLDFIPGYVARLPARWASVGAESA